MPREPLNSIEWHDLPVAALSFNEQGLELVVTPWVESSSSYSRYTLRITEADQIELDVTGAMSADDFSQLEVSRFDYTLSSTGRLCGSIGVLPGNAGYWKIVFDNASWSFVRL